MGDTLATNEFILSFNKVVFDKYFIKVLAQKRCYFLDTMNIEYQKLSLQYKTKLQVLTSGLQLGPESYLIFVIIVELPFYFLLLHTHIWYFVMKTKLYTPSTLNIDLIQWHTHLIVCAVK